MQGTEAEQNDAVQTRKNGTERRKMTEGILKSGAL